MNMKARRQQKLQLTWLGWFQKHTQVGEGVSFRHCMHSSLGCSSNGGCFDQSKPSGDNENVHKGNWQTRKMCSIFLSQNKVSVAVTGVGEKSMCSGCP